MSKKFNPHKYTYHFNIGKNIKLGDKVASWSTLKGDELLYIPRLNKRVRGTCRNSQFCTKDCYVNKSYNRYPKTAMYGHAVNAIGLRTCPAKVFQDLHRQLSVTRRFRVVRINHSGDLENMQELEMWSLLATLHPDFTFYIYTKQFNLALEFIENNPLPKNFHVNFSIWHEHGVNEYFKVAHYPNVHAFVYDDGETYLTATDFCRAYLNGKLNHAITCERCKKCYKPGVKVIFCKSH